MNLIERFKLMCEQIKIVGSDDVGWSARYSGDPNWCWAMKKETVIAGCAQRRDEVLAGTLIRTRETFHTA